jgi:flagellar biosynthetic protein FliQ
MSGETIIHLARQTLETTLWLSAPVLLIAMAVSLAVSVVQVMTSVQETTVATVPRLAAVAGALFVLLPWMVRRLVSFTAALFSDFHPYIG